MRSLRPRIVVVVVAIALVALAVVAGACSSDPGSSSGAPGEDAALDGAGGDGGGDAPSDANADAGDAGQDASRPNPIGAGPYSFAFVGAGSFTAYPALDVTLANGVLDAYDAGPGDGLSRNTNAVGEPFMDPLSAVGRWNGGATAGAFHDAGLPVFSTKQGLHYAVVVETAIVPTSGAATYALAGATGPTIDDGSLAVGTLTGSASATFISVGMKIGLELTIVMPGDATYTVATTGGVGATAASEVGSTGGVTFAAAFPGPIAVTSTGVACQGGSPCKAYVNGMIGGPSADRLGVAILISSGANPISATAVFAKQ
jgi:hypothetical protein